MMRRPMFTAFLAMLWAILPLSAAAQPCVPATLTIDHDSQGLPLVHAVGDPALDYELETADDLSGKWTPRLSFTGSADYADPDALLLPTRFYRAVCQSVDGAMLSQNAVGYVKIDWPKSQRTLASGCLNAPGGLPPAVSQLIGGSEEGQIPLGTTVHVWNGDQFETAVRGVDGWINDPLVQLGRGFWLETGDVVGTDGDIYMVGEVPTGEAIEVTGLSDDVFGVPYPTAVYWEDAILAGIAPVGTTVSAWDGVTFTDHVKLPLGWSGGLVLSVGQGVFISTGTELSSSVCTKPYDWP